MYETLNIQTVFITGATGCVGHYVMDQLVQHPNLTIYALVRDPNRFKQPFANLPNVHICQGDLASIEAYKDVLAQCDGLIHLATDWGDSEEATRLNKEKTHEMLSYCSQDKLKRVVYFSTASILGKGNKVIDEAETYGTGYVRSKYRAYHALKSMPGYEKIITVFPTLVFGGDKTHPFSHISGGLVPSMHYAKWVRFLTMDARFHFLHSKDIATVTLFLLFHSVPQNEYALGMPVVQGKQAILTLCKVFKVPVYFQIKIAPWFLLGLAKLFKIRVAPWDLFCIKNPFFEYSTVNPETFGLPCAYPTLESIVENIKQNHPS